MRTLKFFLTAMIAVALASPMWAQGMSQQKMGMQGMPMGQGMHKMMGQKMMCQMGDSMCPMMGAGHMQGFFLNQAESLGLNDSQIEQLQKIKTTTQKAVIRKEADLKIANLELNELMTGMKAKRSDLETKAKRVEDLRSDIRLTEFKAQLDARAVLTPEQLKKTKSMKMSGMRGGMMQMGSMSQGQNGDCPMMGSSSKSDSGTSEHEKHHPKTE
ncbi:MAG: Spy/CpxP family protein refolding chaperone [bacterium]